jgi:hypothetical protein
MSSFVVHLQASEADFISLMELRKVSEHAIYKPSEGIAGKVWVSKRPVWIRDIDVVRSHPRSRSLKFDRV